MTTLQEAPPPELEPRRPPGVLSLAWGGLVSVALLVAISLQIGHAAPDALRMLAGLPLIILPAFAALYLNQPLADLLIYRRVWGLPTSSLGALLRKTALNEVVLDYTGEAYLYMWARGREGLPKPPFATIRDVNILSATVGFVITLGVVVLAATRPQADQLGDLLRPYLWPLAGVIVLALGGLYVGRRVLALNTSDLVYVTIVHTLRMAIWCALTMTIWSLAAPEAPLGVWLSVLAVALVSARIPFLSNRNLLASNVVLLLLGAHSKFALVLADMALATLAAHLMVIGSLAALALVRRLTGRS